MEKFPALVKADHIWLEYFMVLIKADKIRLKNFSALVKADHKLLEKFSALVTAVDYRRLEHFSALVKAERIGPKFLCIDQITPQAVCLESSRCWSKWTRSGSISSWHWSKRNRDSWNSSLCWSKRTTGDSKCVLSKGQNRPQLVRKVLIIVCSFVIN